MDIQNHYYGHSAALANFAGLRKVRHVSGLIQHGWTVTHPVSTQFGDFATWGPERRRLVWTSTARGWNVEDAASFDAEGRGLIDVIGAPFLYVHQAAQENGTLPERNERTLVFPLHGTALLQVYGDHGEYARKVRQEEGPARVCLHIDDFDNPTVMDAWRSAGHEIVSAGDRRDPLFIGRIAHLVSQAPRVTSNRLSTALMYASYAGAEVAVTGPEFQLGDKKEVDPGRVMRDIWPEFHDPTTPQSVLREIAAKELGVADMKSQAEILKVTGWSGSTLKPAWEYWGHGPVSKAISVLGFTKVPEGARATEAHLSPWHWIKNPLKHLPSPLPKLPAPGIAAPIEH